MITFSDCWLHGESRRFSVLILEKAICFAAFNGKAHTLINGR